LARAPFSAWIAPTWPAGRPETGPFLEHFAVFFWPGALFEKLGLPMGALLFNLISYAALCVGLRRLATALATPSEEGPPPVDAAPIAFLVSPFGLQYLLRANHEVPWAACTVLALAAVLSDGRRVNAVFGAACAGAFLMKGMLALLLFPAAAAALAVRGQLRRKAAVLALGLLAMALAAAAYELAYRRATGHGFFAAYVGEQLSEVREAEQLSALWKLFNPLYYLGLGMWFALPTSVLLLSAAATPGRRTATFAPSAFAAGWIAVLSLMTRNAIRYAFPPLVALHAATPLVLPPRIRGLLSKPSAAMVAPALLAVLAAARILFDSRLAGLVHGGR
jgi:4-amino-4-deoxy-L-arabinose transferase-like glycosyltransferase